MRKKILILLILIVFTLGIFFIMSKNTSPIENFDLENPLDKERSKRKNKKNGRKNKKNSEKEDIINKIEHPIKTNNLNKDFKCPNILIQKDKHIYLYNNKLANIPGVNPVIFNNLEDYVEYIQWQRSQGIHCPVLFLLQGYDAQGKKRYQVRPDPTNLMGGLDQDSSNDQILNAKNKLLDAARNDPPYNKNQYPGFDPLNQYIGLETPLDKIFHQNPNGVSPNPMDSNWGGSNFTQKLVDQGYYKMDNVKIKPA